MANPRVHPHLRFYPEDAGKKVDEYWQASHWHEEVDADRLTPLAEIGKQHFFIYEPCLLTNGMACMPNRWFKRGKKLMAKVWTLRAVSSDSGSHWIVQEYDEIEISSDQFLVGFASWAASGSTNGLPPATQISGQ